MAALSARKIQATALIVALLIVLTSSFAYLAVEREIFLSRQRLHHHMDHMAVDVQALQTALKRLSPAGEKQFFPEFARRLLIVPSDGPITQGVTRYVVHDTGLHLQLQLETPASLPDERTDLGVFGLATALNFYSSLSQASAGSLFPLILLSPDSQIRISTRCYNISESDAHQPNRIASCASRELVLNDLLPKLQQASEKVQLSTVRLKGGETAVLGYRLLKTSAGSELPGGAARNWIAVSYFGTEDSLSQGDDGAQGLIGRVVTSKVELFDAQDNAISPAPLLTEHAGKGWSIGQGGVIFRIDHDVGISARYFTSYGHYFHALGPGLSIIALLLVVSSIATLFIARWYLQRFYEPAQRQIRRVEESEAFGRQVIDAAQLAVVVCSWPDRRILRCNEFAVSWFDSQAQMRNVVVDWTTSYRKAPQGEEQNLTFNDRHVVGQFVATRYEDQDALLCTFRDVSEDVRAKDALEFARKAADESNAAKSEFLATMSHEIRTPMYGVLGMLELLASTPLSQVQQGFIRTIQSSSDQLLNVVGDVLDMSKIEAGGLAFDNEQFSPIELTESVVQVHEPKAGERGIFLHCTIDPRVPPTLIGDAARARQILNNLVSNAIKFTEIGRVVVALTVEGGTAQAIRLRWRVSDTGLGISEAELTHIFEPFYQARSTRRGGGGTGLGLAICSKLVKLMGGRIDATSQRGVGSTFLVELPLTLDQAATAERMDDSLRGVHVYVRAPTQELREHHRGWLTKWGASCELVGREVEKMEAESVLIQVLPEQMSPVAGHTRQVFCTQGGPLHPNRVQQGWQVNCHSLRSIFQALELAAGRLPVGPATDVRVGHHAPWQALERLGLRVLTVEDSVLNQEVLRWQLESLGCEVTICGSPKRALDLWSDERFDILLTDANMPDLSGQEMVRVLRERGMKRPAVCVTANAVSEKLSSIASDGLINAWLAKPVSVRALKICLVEVCADSQQSIPAVHPGRTVPSEKSAEDIPYFVREVFVTTMMTDVSLLRRAAATTVSDGVDEILHRIKGGLVISNSGDLAHQCALLESNLIRDGMSAALVAELVNFCDVLEGIVQAVKENLAPQGQPQPERRP